MKRLYVLILMSMLSGIVVKAQTTVFDSNKDTGFSLYDNRAIEQKSVCSSFEENGKMIYDIEVFKGDRSQYAVGLSFKTSKNIEKGDVLLARISMKTIYAKQETGESAIYYMLQEPAPTYGKSFNVALGCDSEWTTFDIPFKAHTDFPAGYGVVELSLGALAQHILVRDIIIMDYGKDKDLNELPKTRFTYAGREEGAAWREEALERIEKIRASDVVVSVIDKKGRPVKGAQVHVKMDQSDFIWGCSIGAPCFWHDGKIDSTYAANLLRCFNTSVLGNGLKTGGWYENSRRLATLHTMEWLQDNGFRIRGHNLVWPGWKFNSAATRLMAEQDPATFDRYIKAQFYERMAYAKGKVIAWDVINEPMHERDFFNILHEDVMVDWFKLAKELDPDAQLFINEYSMLNCAQSTDNIDAYIDLINRLRSKGAPIEAIGVQGHVGTQPRAPQLVISDLDRFVPLGLPVQITEWDINTKDEELQADYSRDFLIAVYSHPVIEGVTMWGFWQGDHWKPDAALYRKDWSPKSNAAVWDEYVLGKWKTDVTFPTDRKGNSTVHAHFGTYTVTVTYKGKTIERKCHVGKDGLCMQFEID